MKNSRMIEEKYIKNIIINKKEKIIIEFKTDLSVSELLQFFDEIKEKLKGHFRKTIGGDLKELGKERETYLTFKDFSDENEFDNLLTYLKEEYNNIQFIKR